MANSYLNLKLLFLLLFLADSSSSYEAQAQAQKEPYIGVNIGTDVSNLPPPSDLIKFLTHQQITHVRLYEANQDLLQALAHTNIRVIIGIPNNQLYAIASSNSTAAKWISQHILAFFPQTLILAISVGDEILTSDFSSAPLILPAIQSLYNALVASNLQNEIKISTPHASSIILDPFPPSQAYFNKTLIPYMLPLVRFLSRTNSPLMMNLYPYYVFMENKGVVPLDNALFKPLTPNKEMVDPNTMLHYENVLDAMIDAAYFSLRNVNVSDVVVLVTESGWPSRGDSVNDVYATRDNADTYNSNLIRHVYDRKGTPLRPEITSSVYVYELFDEDNADTYNWGLFYGNMTAVYLLHVSGVGSFLANDRANQTYCIAMDGINGKVLQAALDWACGPGKANCSDVQVGESCYLPNNVKSHASYAFDSYYQKQGKAPGTCDFNGVAIITTNDPSHGSCIFPGSKKISNKTRQVSNSTAQTSNAGNNKLRMLIALNNVLHIFFAVTLPFMMLFVFLC